MKRKSKVVRNCIHILFPVCLFLMTLSLTTHAQEPFPKLVGAQWLRENLSRDNLRVVDLRGDVKAYWKEHIPGAVYLNPETLRWPEGGVPVKALQPGALAQLLGELSIDENTLVVAYSSKGDYHATYFIWALDYLGHQHSAILNGGFEEWVKRGGQKTQDYPGLRPTEYPLPSRLNERVRAGVDEVQGAMSGGDVVLLDVRPKDMYNGTKGFWKRNGHIPGARHHFVGDDLTEDGTWKREKDLKKQYETIGVTPDKAIIVMCGSGKMSSLAYVTLKHVLEYPRVKHYDGGINEWSNFEALPMETGSESSVDAEPLLQRTCTRCHNLTRVHREKADRAGWVKIIDRMIKKGTKLTKEEQGILIDYLSEKGKQD